MKIFELAQDDVSTGYYDPNTDKLNGRTLSDTRKPKLTLRNINKLKKMRALQSLESLKRQDLLGIMYGQPEADQGGGLGF